jgi:ADP-ribosylglycohydrolase
MSRDKDRSLGAYIGAAIGDAMGGPVECSHAARIKRLVGEIDGLLPYRKPYSFNDPGPGYALSTDAGSVTDDTFIRGDITRFFLDTRPPRTPALLAEWLLAHADFSMWWPPIIEGLRRVERGEVSAEDGGLTFFQGGGIGWWTPIGILHAADPEGAAAEARNLCRIWKAPLEQDLLACVQAVLAEAMREGASVDSVVDAILLPCGPLARKLIERAIDIALAAKDFDDLVDQLYHSVLMPDLRLRHTQESPRAADAPLPPVTLPVEDTKEKYLSSFFAEQVPIAVAGFLFGKGDPRAAIPCTCRIGRDADSTATVVGSWVGALHGESGLPRDWVETVCRVNRQEIDIRGLAEQLYRLPA